MLPRDDAPQYLQRLAEPTLAAFAEARAFHAGLLDYMADDHARLAAPVAGVFDGVSYWAAFATFLEERFAIVPGVQRITSTHSLAHHWTVDAAVTVQLKSDTGNLPVDQLRLHAVPMRPAASECVILTWDHEHSERFDPAFVQMEGKREVWRVPVVALTERGELDVVAPARPTPIVTSTRRDVEQQREAEAPS
jgi:hypothetical protein